MGYNHGPEGRGHAAREGGDPMTIRIPLRAVLFIVYTAALLGGAAGVAFAVTQTTEGPRGEQGPQGPRGEQGPQGPQGITQDDRECHIALVELSAAVLQRVAEGGSTALAQQTST